MFIDKLFQPAVSIMNKFPFKVKIVISMVILSPLFIMPIYTISSKYSIVSNIHKNQLIGLKYIKQLQNIILVTQLHRGLINGYLNGDEKFKNDVLKKEKLLKQNLINLLDFDKSNLDILSQNKNYLEAISKIDIIELKNISNEIIFDKHISIIESFANTIKDISYLTFFSGGHNLKISYIAKLLQFKLLKLQEYTAVMRDKVNGYFIKQDIPEKKIQELLSLYTLVEIYRVDLSNNDVLIGMDNYLTVKKKIRLMSYKLQELLKVVNKQIFINKELTYSGQDFFEQATNVIVLQDELYKLLSTEYFNMVKNMQSEENFNIRLLILGFLAILFSTAYIFIASFRSVKQSLGQLQNASEMISRGDRNINLQVNSNDEIGDALLAFNKMSQILDKNINFLDTYKYAIDETSIVSKTDKRGIITYVNKLFCEISGYSESELLSYPHNMVRHPEMPKDAFEDLWKTIKDKKTWKGLVKNRKKDGGYYIVDAVIMPLFNAQGEIIEYISIRHDVTELEDSKVEIQKQKIDILTKLPNRNSLIDDLKTAKYPILFYLNIDNFAGLNDFYGSQIGDQTLIHIANIIKDVADNIEAKLYKLQADEFMLYFEKSKLKQEQYKKVFKRIINHIEQRTIDCNKSNCVSINISAGIVFCGDGKSIDNLINYAIIARKFAKSKNKKFLVYSKDMQKDDDYANNIKWINEIKEALKEQRVVAYFQPIIYNSNDTITKYEALVRMIDKDGKPISPFFFLDIAKKAKLYPYIAHIMIDKVFELSLKKPELDITINLEVEDVMSDKACKYIFDKLDNHPYPDHIVFEITESQEIKNYEAMKEFIKKVKSYGSKIAIDDFGSGYSNFEQVLALNADIIKIDGSLIKNIATDENSRIITETIINFSKKLGSKTVVEYVHNKEVSDIVKELGADYSQGFYLGEPKPEIVNVESIIKTTEV